MKTIAVQIPVDLYADLEAFAMEEQNTPEELLITFLRKAVAQHRWQKDWQALRKLVQGENGPQPPMTEEEVEQLVEQTRKTRQEIFEAEYAHLYR